MPLKLEYTDFPILFQQADTASIQEQQSYILCRKFEFALVVLAAILGGFLVTDAETRKILGYATASAFALAFISRIVSKVKPWDKTWFEARAIAESVKTITWRYIMRVPPFHQQLGLTESDQEFIKETTAIFKNGQVVAPIITSIVVNNGAPITEKMRALRTSDFETRKGLYINERIMNQKNWYSSKSSTSKKHADGWFWMILAVELAGVFCAYFTAGDSIGFNPLGLLTTLAGVFLAWIQIKKYQELELTYAIASQELGSIECLARTADDEGQLIRHVIDAENSISREHTMWCAKNR